MEWMNWLKAAIHLQTNLDKLEGGGGAVGRSNIKYFKSSTRLEGFKYGLLDFRFG